MRRPTTAAALSRRRLLLGGAALAVAATQLRPAAAHHGWRSFGDTPFELSGTVEEVFLGNPHGELAVRADDGVWEVGLGPPYRNRRAGIEEGTIAVGDRVTAIGKRARDPEERAMKTERLIVGERTYDIYPERLRDS